MCGIAGALAGSVEDARAAVEAMCEQLIPRGPDDHGIATSSGERGSASLGSRRLAIIDPSPAGHQPMVDAERETTIVFNGMIYNFGDLRERLSAEGEPFVSDCDTEVVLRAYGRYGRDCVRHLRGMFAFAVWDERRRELFLARDRLGIKPLYYTERDGWFLFASQVKALLRTGRVPAELSAPALDTYLAFGAVSEPLTAIEGVSALPAGHTALVREGTVTVARYWEPPAEPDASLAAQDAADELCAVLEDTVRRHLVSDAPLGVFLSGGLDSSLVAALAAQASSRVRTVSVAFADRKLS